MVNIAVIGTGNISNCHICAYQKNSNVKIVAFCDTNEEILKQKGEQYGVTQIFTDVDEILSKVKEIDAVSICTWNCYHSEIAIKALNAGKHVLCEKPMAMTVKQSQDMLDAAEKSGKILMIGFVRRFGNDAAVAKEFIDAGAIGDVYFAKANYLRRHGNPGGWFCSKELSGGGPLIDLGVHIIDLVSYLTGKPKAVSVYGVTFKKLGTRDGIKDKKDYHPSSRFVKSVCDVEDLAIADIRFENGAALHIETSFCVNVKKESGDISLYGTKGGMDISPQLALYTDQNGYLVDTNLATPVTLDFTQMFDNEINHFVDCIATGKKPISTASDGIAIMKIIEGIYRSAETGHEVIL